MDYEKLATQIISKVRKMNRDFKAPEAGYTSRASVEFEQKPQGVVTHQPGDGNDKEPGGTQSYHGTPDSVLGTGAGPSYNEVRGGTW